ncbi:MAG: hypothetical protein AB8B79_05675 [Granulosicoccus sp.]
MRYPVIILLLTTAMCVSSCSFKGSELWRKKVCDSIIDSVERERCLEEATRSENDYQQEKNEALN